MWLFLPLYLVGFTISVKSQTYSKRPPSSGCQLSDPIPSQYVCEQEGTVTPNGPDVLDPEPAELGSFQECLDLCSRRNYICTSFAYNRTSNLCMLFNNDAEGLRFKHRRNTSTIYSEYSCYDCHQLECPQDPTISVVDNGDFEYSSNSTTIGPWADVGYTGEAPLEIVHPGSRGSENALRCEPRSEGDDAVICEFYQYIKMCQSMVYAITFDYKAAASKVEDSYRFAYSIRFYVGDTYHLIQRYRASGTHGWKSKTLYFNCDEDLSDCDAQAIFIQVFDQVHLDNIQVYPVPALQYVPGAKNLLENGNFETGDLAPWKHRTIYGKEESWFSVISPGYNSNYQLLWEYMSMKPYQPPVSASANLSQRVSTTPGRRYLLVFDVQLNKEIDLEFSIGPNIGYDIATPTVNRIRHQVPYIAQGSTTEIRFAFRTIDYGKGYLDNIDFREVQ